MHGNNARFLSDPVSYVGRCTIDVFGGLGVDLRNPSSRLQRSAIDLLKEGTFDLRGDERDGPVELVNVGNVVGDAPITAYWCPYVAGVTTPGFVDIPKMNPKHKLVFTPAMNGCAFVVTDCPGEPSKIRVYHNQHPEYPKIDALILDGARKIISMLTFEDYGQRRLSRGVSNSFNFLHYVNGGWRIVSQPQILTPKIINAQVSREQDVRINGSIGVKVIDAFHSFRRSGVSLPVRDKA